MSMYILDAIKNDNSSEYVKGLLYVSYTILASTIILTYYYATIFMIDVQKSLFYNAPLNIQAFQYKCLSLFKRFTNINYFNIYYITFLHFMSFILGLIAIVYSSNKSAYASMLICNLVAIVVCIGCILYFSIKHTDVKEQVNTLNKDICGMIYKKVDFLTIIKESKINSEFDIRDTIIKCLNTIDSTISEEDLVKVFFTLTMFNHFAKIYHSNKEIEHDDIFKLFDHSVLLCKKCEPVSYLQKSAVHIDHIVDTYIADNLPFRTSNTISASKECTKIVDKITASANNLNLDKVSKSYFMILMIVLCMHMIIIVVVHWSYVSEAFNESVNATKRFLKGVKNTGDVSYEKKSFFTFGIMFGILWIYLLRNIILTIMYFASF